MLGKFFKSKKRVKSTIAIASGGTGGHIFPALVVAEDLIKNGYEVLFLTDKRFHNFSKYFNDIIQSKNFTLLVLDAEQSGRSFLGKIGLIFRTIKITYQCFNLLKIYRIGLSIGFGSYTSFPVILASFLRKIPSLIHEQNAFIGFSNRLASFFAKKIMTSFADTHGFYRFTLRKAVFVGMPIRKEIAELYYENQNHNINYPSFYRTSQKINILILGGSQGSAILTKVFLETAAMLDKSIRDRLFVYHQCRSEDVSSVVGKYNDMGVKSHVQSFFPDAGRLMTMSHLCISRSGAGSICDLAASGAPTIFVPLRSAKDNHQLLNARCVYEGGGCILIEERDFNANKLSLVISSIIESPKELFDLSLGIKKFAKLDSSEKICNIINDAIKAEKNFIKNGTKSVKTNDVGIG